MARRREKLARAPIVEAVIDIRIAPATMPTLETFTGAQSLLGPEFKSGIPMHSIDAEFSAGNIEIRHRNNQVGILFRSVDEKRVVQFRVNGFTFNRLEPYSDWLTVFGEAMRLWGVYAGLNPSIRVTRLAVRYINRMMLAEATSLADYLTVPPMLPEEVPQHLREYLSRVVIQDVERNMSAVLVQALEPGPQKGTGAILLDVDAFQEVQFGLDPQNPQIQRIFTDLRDLKNQIFFACITEQAAERYA